MLGLQILKCLL